MNVLDVAYWVACVVLVVSGVTKVAEPSATDATLRGIGFGVPRNSARVLGAAEVVLGCAGLLAVPGAVAQAVASVVAVAYVGFALVVLAALRKGLSDCGCLGVRSRRPTIGHAVVNLVLAGFAGAAAVLVPTDLAGGLGSVSVLIAVGAGLVVATVAGLVVARY